MAQRNIDFGTFPDDPSADPIRSAFQKTQQNFTEIFQNQTTTGVSSVNKNPGSGITVNKPTGDVIVSANIACVKVYSTGLNLSILGDSTPTSFVTLTQSSSQTLSIEFPANVNTLSTGVTNISLSGNITATTITSTDVITATGNIQGGNLISTGIVSATGNVTGNFFIGNGSQLTGVVAITSNTAQTVTTNAQPNITSVGTLTSLSVSGNSNIGNIGTAGLITATGNITGDFFIGNGSLLTGIADPTTIQNGNSNVVVAANANVTVSVGGNSNVVVISNAAVSVAGNVEAGNINTANSIIIAGGSGGNISGANNITANFFIGNGSLLTNVNSSNITGQVANALVAGTVYTNAQPNITSTGTLTSLSVSGNANIGNIGTAGLVTATGNIQGGNLITTGILSVGGNANVGNIGATNGVFTNVSGNGALLTDLPAGNITGQVANALVAGTVYTNAQPNITSVGTLANLSISGNANIGNYVNANTGIVVATGTGGSITGANSVSANYFIGNGSLLTNVNSSNITGQVANSLVAGTVYTNAQPNITSVGTLSSLSVSGNANVGNIGATNGVFTNVSGNGALLTSITGANVTGTVANATYATSAGSATTAGTVTTNAQPNITSVGTLSSLSVSGNVTASYFIGNIIGNISGNISAPGSNTQILFNDEGSVAGSTGLTFNKTTNALSTTGTLSATGNANVGNLGTAGLITSTGNIQGGNLRTTGILSVDGNANVGNIGATNGVFTNVSGNGGLLTNLNASNITGQVANALVAGTVYTNAQPNITSTGTLTSLSVSGNANIGNIGATNGVFTNVSGNGSGLTNLPAANVTGQVANALVAGTVYTNAQPNITSVGTLTSISVSGNANIGNIGTAGLITATGNIIGGNIIGTLHVGNLSGTGNSNVGNLGVTGVFSTTLSATGNANVGNIGATNGLFTNVSGNGSGLTGVTAVTAQTVTNAAQPNITAVGTLSSLNIDGNLVVGNNLFVNGNLTYLNVETLAVEDPIIQLQTGANGAAPSSNSGKDIGTALNYYDTAAKIAFMGWDTSNAEIAFGANVAIANEVVTFNQLANTRSGNTLTTGVFTTTLSATGNANIGNIGATNGVFTNISGNGASLTSLPGSNVTGQVANALVAGTVYTASQPNITSTGTLTSLSVSSNANVGNLGTAGLITATGNIQGGNLRTTGILSVGGNANVGNLGVTGVFATTLSATGNANTGNIGATNGVFTNVSGNGSALTSITGASVTGTVANATFATSAGSATTAGTVTTAAQSNITSVGTLTSLSVSGNANVGNIGATNGVFTNVSGNGAALTSITGANVTGQVANALVAGTVYTNAQPNITSVGTLSALSVSGNANVGGIITSTLSVSNLITFSSQAGISAAGADQSTATALTKIINEVTTVSVGQGVRLPTIVQGYIMYITNNSANALFVYPAAGNEINSLGTNNSLSIVANTTLQFIAGTSTKWYTVGATYA